MEDKANNRTRKVTLLRCGVAIEGTTAISTHSRGIDVGLLRNDDFDVVAPLIVAAAIRRVYRFSPSSDLLDCSYDTLTNTVILNFSELCRKDFVLVLSERTKVVFVGSARRSGVDMSKLSRLLWADLMLYYPLFGDQQS
jgi:hypothetical protein